MPLNIWYHVCNFSSIHVYRTSFKFLETITFTPVWTSGKQFDCMTDPTIVTSHPQLSKYFHFYLLHKGLSRTTQGCKDPLCKVIGGEWKRVFFSDNSFLMIFWLWLILVGTSLRVNGIGRFEELPSGPNVKKLLKHKNVAKHNKNTLWE